jgi:hypothetical protein
MLGDEVKLSRAADEDLTAIGRPTENFLFGELSRLPYLFEEDCRDLFWQRSEKLMRRIEIGDYSATFSITTREDGWRIIRVERVALRADLDRWLSDRVEEAEAAE